MSIQSARCSPDEPHEQGRRPRTATGSAHACLQAVRRSNSAPPLNGAPGLPLPTGLGLHSASLEPHVRASLGAGTAGSPPFVSPTFVAVPSCEQQRALTFNAQRRLGPWTAASRSSAGRPQVGHCRPTGRTQRRSPRHTALLQHRAGAADRPCGLGTIRAQPRIRGRSRGADPQRRYLTPEKVRGLGGGPSSRVPA